MLKLRTLCAGVLPICHFESISIHILNHGNFYSPDPAWPAFLTERIMVAAALFEKFMKVMTTDKENELVIAHCCKFVRMLVRS